MTNHHPPLQTYESNRIMLDALRTIAEDGTLTAVRCRGIAVAALEEVGYPLEDARQRLRESDGRLAMMSAEIARLRAEIASELNGEGSE